MKKMTLVFVLQAAAIAAVAQAPGGNLSVTVTNEAGSALEGATVEIRKSKDSALVKTALTDRSGAASVERLAAGTYLLRVSMTGHAPAWSPLFSVSEGGNTTVPALRLAAGAAKELQGVTVAARKPFIQKLSDRIVVNVENSILSAGASALEVLERAPGVTLDQNDAISLRGRSGVIIMIDGKPTPMTGSDLANYLKGLPSSAIERIDIITNPSAKYDAAGNSGIIDIRLRKDQRLGTNGTLTASYGQGFLPKTAAGGSLNYRNKAVNLFANYNFAYREHLNHLFIHRRFFEEGVARGSDKKDNYAKMPVSNHTVRVGADFFPSKNTIIGFVVNSNFTHFRRRADIKTNVFDSLGRPDFNFLSLGTNNDHNDNAVGNINLKTKLDSNGRELTADIDYGSFRTSSITRTGSNFYNLDGTPKRAPDILDGDQQGTLRLATAKVDYTHPLGKGARLEAGLKTSYVSSDNDARFYNVYGTSRPVDTTKTNRFFYEEYNNAAYLNGSKEWKKWSLQVGLRGEQTNVRTRQAKDGRRFRNDYFQLFPSAFLNYKVSDDKTIGVSVSRRIDRPGYSQLNPFLFQIDATIYSTGAPQLLPQFTWSYEASYTVKGLNFTLGYSRTKNPQSTVLSPILDVIPTFEIEAGKDSNITVQIPVNLVSSDYVGLTATLPWRVRPWWNLMGNVNVYYTHFNGNIGGAQLSNGAPAANIRINNTLTLPKGWGAEVNGFVNTGGRTDYMVMQPQWSLSAGVQKSVLQGRGTVRLNVNDIFLTNLPRATVTYEGRYIEHWNAVRDSRVGTLSFNYRFGNNKVAAARRRSTASEEERRRAGG
ncbi:TonB-dependent receptor domain-containing protein [Flaviaesturariibacter amylovorans]|uniref:Outer membrane beta-barrel family protein n=1 Tax=Flaviaesturariibacter amylovorans TaxID=1084520 RepID=A0ABP8HPL9_9BACT